ncbi:MAG: alpha/beta hydrolase-fold protein [Bacteroidia bacterium]|nr:alpha/beta hydrolase-fold protein [Bacteroidia bacterium]
MNAWIKKLTVITTLLTGMIAASHAQPDSLLSQGMYRHFVLHLPAGYDPGNTYPLVLNIHGLNSNAAQQQAYTQFDAVADALGFIVVYPDAYDGSWHYGPSDTPNDLTFIQDLVDTVRAAYSTHDCLFAMGMSFGGFFSYKLACSMELNAVAVVSGNFTNSLRNTCSPAGPLPVMHIHGTDDPLVNYNGTLGIPPVDSTVRWWVSQNHCTATPVTTALPDINIADSSTVTRYDYENGDDASEVILYKISHGGHTWPGAAPIPPFGFTNLDMAASTIIGDFFKDHCAARTDITPIADNVWRIYPNPFHRTVVVENVPPNTTYTLLSATGQVIWRGKDIAQQDFSYLSRGIYFLAVASSVQAIHKD